jgi:hypothetical protein
VAGRSPCTRAAGAWQGRCRAFGRLAGPMSGLRPPGRADVGPSASRPVAGQAIDPKKPSAHKASHSPAHSSH